MSLSSFFNHIDQLSNSLKEISKDQDDGYLPNAESFLRSFYGSAADLSDQVLYPAPNYLGNAAVTTYQPVISAQGRSLRLWMMIFKFHTVRHTLVIAPENKYPEALSLCNVAEEPSNQIVYCFRTKTVFYSNSYLKFWLEEAESRSPQRLDHGVRKVPSCRQISDLVKEAISIPTPDILAIPESSSDLITSSVGTALGAQRLARNLPMYKLKSRTIQISNPLKLGSNTRDGISLLEIGSALNPDYFLSDTEMIVSAAETFLPVDEALAYAFMAPSLQMKKISEGPRQTMRTTHFNEPIFIGLVQ